MYLYAIRDKTTGKLIHETGIGTRKTWYPAAGWAEKRIVKLCAYSPRFKEDNLEVVKFELKEVK